MKRKPLGRVRAAAVTPLDRDPVVAGINWRRSDALHAAGFYLAQVACVPAHAGPTLPCAACVTRWTDAARTLLQKAKVPV